jgi:hypothetical protein
MQPTPFELLSVGSDLRTLTVAYEAGPCWQGDPQASLTGTSRAVRISVAAERVEGCTGPVEHRRLQLRLRRPLAGRPIEGEPRIAAPTPDLARSTTPPLLDAGLADARRALALQGYGVRVIGRQRGTVAFQSPRPGARAEGGTVRLTVGRHLFRARALRRCVAPAVWFSHTTAPRPGDEDAPDLALSLVRPNVIGFVALYADPARGRELAPEIRRGVRRLPGLVERRAHATIIWTDRPPPRLRRRAHRCLSGELGRPRT